MRRSAVGPIIDIRSITGLHGRHPNLLYPSTSILCCVSASGGRNGPRSLQRALRALAQGAGTEGRNGFVPQHARRATQRRQRPVATGEACAGRRRELSVVEIEAGVAARAEAQRGNGAAAGGRDCSVVALWLGHETIETTQTYLHAHLALSRQHWPSSSHIRVIADDRHLMVNQ
jgi:hypothetical protein